MMAWWTGAMTKMVSWLPILVSMSIAATMPLCHDFRRKQPRPSKVGHVHIVKVRARLSAVKHTPCHSFSHELSTPRN